MKQALVLLVVLATTLSLASCGQRRRPTDSVEQPDTAKTSTTGTTADGAPDSHNASDTKSTASGKEALKTVPEKERKLSASEQKEKDELVAKVLDPARFRTEKWQDRPTVPAAYTIAKKHPDILQRLFCYCGCDLTEKHVTLLDCFTDTDEHGATCSECIDEAFLADRLFKDGATMARIQQIVDEQFCPKYPFSPNERTKTYKAYLAKRLYTDSKEPICGNQYSGE